MNDDSLGTNGCTKRKRSSSKEEGNNMNALVSPNFEELARISPPFGRAWKAVQQSQAASGGPLSAHITQDFSVALTQALLHMHWGLSLSHLPSHHLCPPVPNRYFFVQWIQRELLPLLENHRCFFPTKNRHGQLSHTGLDIGTGASCIYPLLHAATDASLRLYATDIDPEPARLAMANVQENRLESRIAVVLVPPVVETNDSSQPMMGPLRQSLHALPSDTVLDFAMTNPPFYDDSDETRLSQSLERLEPRAGDGRCRTAMTVSEGSYPGGEVGFVQAMLLDSLVLYAQGDPGSVPGWTCCMCGKKSSWIKLQHYATTLLGTAHVQATQFGPGHLTRWFLAWTLERPQATSSLAQKEKWDFEVDVVGAASRQEATKQVVERTQHYCESLPGWARALQVEAVQDHSSAMGQWRIQIREAFPSPTWLGDDALPKPIQNVLSNLDPARRVQLLPPEGHFLLNVAVTSASRGSTVVNVQFEAYEHSLYGKKAIEKIKSQVQGEVCRTNRRWRRRLKREPQQELSQAQSMEE